MEIVACRISIFEDKEEGVSTHLTADNNKSGVSLYF